jgi:hypothetical protein
MDDLSRWLPKFMSGYQLLESSIEKTKARAEDMRGLPIAENFVEAQRIIISSSELLYGAMTQMIDALLDGDFDSFLLIFDVWLFGVFYSGEMLEEAKLLVNQ